MRSRSTQVASGHLCARRAAGQAAGRRSAIARAASSRAMCAMRRDRPAVVVGLWRLSVDPGAGRRRWLLQLPRMIHEQNGVLGRVNRLFARAGRRGGLRHLADRRCPAGRGACIPATRCARRCSTGPVRPTSRRATTRCRSWSSAAARARASCRTWCPPADRRAARRICARDLRVAQQARPEDVERGQAAYAERGHRGRGADLLRRRAATAWPRRSWSSAAPAPPRSPISR